MGSGLTLRLSYGSTVIDFGVIESFSESFQKSCNTIPLVSLKSANAFCLETGSSMIFTIRFARKNPSNPITGGIDSTRWSNSEWKQIVEGAVDRWQCRTDGFLLELIPDTTGDSINPYVTPRTERGYIKSLSISYSSENPELLEGSMEFHVGTMFVETTLPDPTQTIPQSEFSILMSNSTNTVWYYLLSEEFGIDCVKSYTLSGGMESPFEVLNMVIPKNRLSSVAPELVEGIVAGQNKVIVNAVGRCSMTVTKCKLSNKNFTITAYSNAEVLRGYTLDTSATMTPFGWIRYILEEGKFGISFNSMTDNPDDATFLYSFNNTDDFYDMLSFEEGTSVWYVLQVCAMYLGCKVFFSGDKAYLVDYRIQSGSTFKEGSVFDYHGSDESGNGYTLDLYSASTDDPIYGRVTGDVSLGDEGTDTIINSQTIRCRTSETDTSTTAFTYYDEESRDQYKEHAGSSLSIPELIQGGNYNQAQRFAENLISYRAEPQQSISFTVKEMEQRGNAISWSPFFAPSTRIRAIRDQVNDTYITNMSSIDGRGRVLQKLMVSSYEYSYPDGQTEYTCGVVSNIDLSSSTSQIISSVSNA